MNLRVDWLTGVSLSGTILKWLSLTLVLPVIPALYYEESIVPFVITALIYFVVGSLLELLSSKTELGTRETFLTVASTWLLAALIGATPYLWSGIGSFAYPINALFESMSGFTTTGSTILLQIDPELHGYGIMLWRQLTQWLGGMGIVVLAVAILPRLKIGGAQLMEAEAPGPRVEKLTPHIKQTAQYLWQVYVGLTLVEIGLLWGLYGLGVDAKMNFYNAVCHGLTTMPTGGFSPEAESIMAFSSLTQWVIIPFMFLAGTNFALLWFFFRGKFKRLLKNKEFQVYASLVGGLIVFLTLFLVLTRPIPATLLEWETTLRESVFQVLAIITTTGYANADFAAWHLLPSVCLMMAMVLGGSTGSTAGGLKILRWIIIVKFLHRELYNTIHPHVIKPIRLGKQVVDEQTIRGIVLLSGIYLFLLGAGAVFLIVDSNLVGTDLSLIEGFTAAAATLGNIGPGLGAVGPMGDFDFFSIPSKLLMILFMWMGRLEIVTVAVLLLPTFWKD